jgi:flagellar hook assembly protein FlgD
MNPSDYNFNDEEDMEVSTKDTTYNLMGNDYYFKNDTLFVTVTKKLDNRTNFKYKLNIPAEEIKMLEVKKVDVLLDKELTTGTYEVEWDASGLPSGVYFYQLKTNEFVETKKMILLK